MAATLTAAGFALVAARRWFARRGLSGPRHWRRRLPSPVTATASLVVLVGAGLALRAVAAVW
jgi:hypothetical protein